MNIAAIILAEDQPSYGWAVAKMLVALVAVLAGLLLVAKLAPRWLRTAPRLGNQDGDKIEIVGSRALEPGRTLYIIKVRGREFLIASGEQGCSVIAEVSAGASADGKSVEAPPKTFPSPALFAGGKGPGQVGQREESAQGGSNSGAYSQSSRGTPV